MGSEGQHLIPSSFQLACNRYQTVPHYGEIHIVNECPSQATISSGEQPSPSDSRVVFSKRHAACTNFVQHTCWLHNIARDWQLKPRPARLQSNFYSSIPFQLSTLFSKFSYVSPNNGLAASRPAGHKLANLGCYSQVVGFFWALVLLSIISSPVTVRQGCIFLPLIHLLNQARVSAHFRWIPISAFLPAALTCIYV